MKNYILATLLGGLVLWTGCTNDELTQDIASDQPHVLKVKVENTQADTRTQVGEDGSVTWTENDQIGVFVEGETTSIPFTFSSMAGDVASFTGTLPEGKEPIAAYYPYQEEARLEGNSLKVVLPEEYEYTGYSNGPMLGLPDGEGVLCFKHLCGLLAVCIQSIPEGAVKLQVESGGWPDPALHGDFIVEDITAEEPVLADNVWECMNAVYHFPADWAGQSKTFYIPIPPADYTGRDGMIIRLMDAEGNSLWYKHIKVVMERGVMWDMPDITETEPVVVITSHENGSTIQGYGAVQYITLKGYIDNYYRFDGYLTLHTEEGREVVYDNYWNPGLPQGRFNMNREYFEQEVQLHRGKNIYSIAHKGMNSLDEEINAVEEFVLYYEENDEPAEAIDLGLSVKWANCNLGAEHPEDNGWKYCWGDNTGTDLNCHDDYKEIWGPDINGDVYISGYSMWDAATYKWGDAWRIPTPDDFEELDSSCEKEEVTINGKRGVRFTGPNGNSIFLPYDEEILEERGKTILNYWMGMAYDYADGRASKYDFSYRYDWNTDRILEFADKTAWDWCAGRLAIRPVYGDVQENDETVEQ